MWLSANTFRNKEAAMAVDVEREMTVLRGMTVPELQERYAQVFQEAVTTRHKPYLIKRIIWRMQANHRGGLTPRARQRARELANEADLRLTAPQMPQGRGGEVVTLPIPDAIREYASEVLPLTTLTRWYKGRKIEVDIVENGVRWDGELYPSLSAVAKAVTGSHWNGRAFFGLDSRKRRGSHGEQE